MVCLMRRDIKNSQLTFRTCHVNFKLIRKTKGLELIIRDQKTELTYQLIHTIPFVGCSAYSTNSGDFDSIIALFFLNVNYVFFLTFYS